jgi:hypothetical protein
MESLLQVRNSEKLGERRKVIPGIFANEVKETS